MSGYQDSNLGPPAPKAGALTGLRYTPNVECGVKIVLFPALTKPEGGYLFSIAIAVSCKAGAEAMIESPVSGSPP